MHDPAAKAWKTWPVPGGSTHVYAVYVDDRDHVWVSEWSHNAIHRFDPGTGKFESYAMPDAGANVRQINGRHGEVWLPESGREHIALIRTP
jgi:virginiamycin B lyase